MADSSRCPRCGGVFVCGARDPAPCWCVGLPLDGELLDALARDYKGCLCSECLAELQLSCHPGESRDPLR